MFTEITLKNHRQLDFARFITAIEKVDQVIECHLVSGGYDYLVKFVTTGIDEYQTIMERLLDLDIGIDKYFSFIVLKSPLSAFAACEPAPAVTSYRTSTARISCRWNDVKRQLKAPGFR